MFTVFDPSKILISKKNNYINLSDNILKLLTSCIVKNHGGILRPNTEIELTEYVYSQYTIIIIQNNPYVLVQKIGQGAYGSVLKGYDLVNKKYVAVKKQGISNSNAIVKQSIITRSNGIGLADISSNLPPTFLMDNFGYFTLPLADISFDKWIIIASNNKKYKDIISIILKISDDLIKLHQNGYVHMDLKPDNILMIDNIAYLSDFGQSERRGKCIPSALEEPKNYPQCAPEYFNKINKDPFYTVSSKFDLYSLGNLIIYISRLIKDNKIKGELINISTYLTRLNPSERISLETLKNYLLKLLYI